MLVKIYWSAWALCAVASILLFVTGNFTMLTSVALGFIWFGLIFMGMMSVLPAAMAHPAEMKPAKPQPTLQTKKSEAPAKGIGVLKSA